MQSLVEAIANGAGRCDATTLNATLLALHGDDAIPIIDNQLPYFCSVYKGHEYTRVNLPVYVGDPKDGGHWVDR